MPTAEPHSKMPLRERVRGLCAVAAVLFGFCVPISLVWFIAGLRDLESARASVTWPRVPAVITQSYFADVSPRQLDIEYAYSVGGAPYRARRVMFSGVISKAHAREFVARFPPGAKVEAIVDPADPAHAALLAGPQPGSYQPLAMALVMWCLLVVALLTRWLLRPRVKSTPDSPAAPVPA